MEKKKLILVGNKPTKKDGLANIVDSFDFVVRVNRMTNLYYTGSKIDGHYLGMWKDFIEEYDGGEYKDKIKEAKVIFCPPKVYNNTQNLFKYITRKQFMTAEIINLNASTFGINTDFPTSTISVLWYLLNSHWVYEYDIYITCIDVEGRGELFLTNNEWCENNHKYAGIDEEKYLKALLENNIITRIADE